MTLRAMCDILQRRKAANLFAVSSADGWPQMRLPMRAVVCAKACIDKTNTASGVWADTAYRSAANETFLNKNGFISHIHRKKPKGRAMPETMRRANNAKSKSARLSSMYSASKGSDGAIHQNYRDRPSNDQDRNGQSRLQHQTLYLPAQGRRHCTRQVPVFGV